MTIALAVLLALAVGWLWGHRTARVRHVPIGATAEQDEGAILAAQDADRAARRDSLHVLLARLDRGVGLTRAETDLLRDHINAEVRAADIAHAVARGNLRHVQTIVPEIDRLAAELEDAEQHADRFRRERNAAQAAIERVRTLTEENPVGIDTALIHAALADSEESTAR